MNQLTKKGDGYQGAYDRRHKVPVCVHVMLVKDGDILMTLRKNKVADDNQWGLPGGHLDAEETFYDAAIRELREELGIDVASQDLTLCNLGHAYDPSYIGIFFQCLKWNGEIENLEPNKCHKLVFHPLDNLPENTTEYLKHILKAYCQNDFYVTFDQGDKGVSFAKAISTAA